MLGKKKTENVLENVWPIFVPRGGPRAPQNGPRDPGDRSRIETNSKMLKFVHRNPDFSIKVDNVDVKFNKNT